MKVVACTSCGARLKVKPSAQRVKCSKCNTSFEVASATASPTSVRTEIASSQRPVASHISVPTPKAEQAESLGFFAYVWRSYNRTHSSLPFMLAMILSLLLMPVLSFLKPKIGVSAVIWSFGITLGVSLALFVVLVVIASSRYLFLKQRTISDDQRNWLSAFICFLVMLTPALGIVAAAESFTPAEGLLVKLVPQFKDEQTRLLGDVAENSGEQPSESNDADSQVVSADNTSTTKRQTTDSDDGNEELALADTKSSGRAKQTKSKSESSNEDGDQEVESTPKKTAQKTKTSNNKTASSDSEPKTKQVVAEGVGATKSDAEKDAFRNAVMQVVGAVVDAETLIKNDEVIEDKVLTYSAGCIKQGWETLSEKTQGGLVRIKIKVEVEQRSVVAKLKAANVTMKQVDGKGLFAEVVTQLDAEKDAQALVEKALKGFPLNCLKAEVVGKPELVKKSDSDATIKITITFATDLEAYDAFAKRFEQTLKGIAKQKTDFTIKASSQFENTGKFDFMQVPISSRERTSVWCELMPQLTTWFTKDQLDLYSHDGKKNSDPVCVALNLQRTKGMDRSDWKCFLVDSSARQPLSAVSACVFTAKLSLLDKDGSTLATERFPITNDLSQFPAGDHYHASCVVCGGGHGQRSDLFPDPHRGEKLQAGFLEPYFSIVAGQENEWNREFMFVVSPFFWNRQSDSMDYRTALTFSPTLTLSLDELKAVDSIKCEVLFDGDLPPKIPKKRK